MTKGAVVMTILAATAAAAGGVLMFQRHRPVSPPPRPIAQEPLQESSVPATLPPERFTARLVIRTAEQERAVHLYVNEVLQGTAPLAKEIYVEEGEYVIRAVVRSDKRAGAFHVVEKKIAVRAGERRVIDMDVPAMPFENMARPMEARYVQPCSVGFGDVLTGSPDDPDPVVPHIRMLQKVESEMQKDDLMIVAANLEHAYRSAPPATGRVVFPRIPVWSYDGDGNVVTSHLDLELDAAQVTHLGRWVEVTDYGLDEYQDRVEDTHRLLTNRYQWAVQCGHADYSRLLQPRVDTAQRVVESARLFRQQISTKFTSIARSLEAAAE